MLYHLRRIGFPPSSQQSASLIWYVVMIMLLSHLAFVLSNLKKVERFNLRQINMETGQQVRMHVRNLLETAED